MNIESISKFYQINQPWPPKFGDHGHADTPKAGIPLPDFKEFDGIGVDEVIGCDSCLLRSHPIFSSHCPTNRMRFLLYLSPNAFRGMIEIIGCHLSDRV